MSPSRAVILWGWLAAVVAATPTFPEEYEAELEMRMPYTGLVMPLKITTTLTSQRIDAFRGTQVENSSAVDTVKYVWNNSRRVCLVSPPAAGPKGSGAAGPAPAASWRPAQIFPNLTLYTRVEDELATGFWQYKASRPHGTTGTMNDEWIFLWDPLTKKPMRWQMHTRNPFEDSHTDIWIFEYLSLEPKRQGEVLSTELPKECEVRKIPINSQLRTFFAQVHTLGFAAYDPSISFDAFLTHHGKQYSKEEYPQRQKLFEKNARMIAALNKKHIGRTTFKGNGFLDMSVKEVLSYRGGVNRGLHRQGRHLAAEHLPFVRPYEYDPQVLVETPNDFDWATQKPDILGPVKDQGTCGSCWTFSFIGPVEARTAMKTGKRPLLPEQFVIDCAWNFFNASVGGNSGCDGGDTNFAAISVLKTYKGKIPTADAYGGYLSVDGYCKDISKMQAGAWITGFVQLPARNEQVLLHAVVTEGPISVGMIVPEEMNYYDTGVLNVESCLYNNGTIDHAVVLVGFGTDAFGTDYYKIRNSWSSHWGDKGYIKVIRGEFDCAIANDTGYTDVSVGPPHVDDEFVTLYA
eukprot:TRINITY_DN55409_c0_g1_i1.p1 TRINITY_DN55409_c0_g1~~TRINITY_DN55409_c0_g1_i1.p1  ORF type:complete len:597 (-),score=103.04 TRINITY_DN55409_c0_g1_i1:147-1871(-)